MTKLAQVTDPLAMIEAAYDTNPDFESWARGVLESSVPVFDAGLGVIGLTIRISEPGSIFEFGAGALSEDNLKAVGAMTRRWSRQTTRCFFAPGPSERSRNVYRASQWTPHPRRSLPRPKGYLGTRSV
jgi:hypothetical protein